jgi:hypothetical protein
VTSQGSPSGRFIRAIQNGNVRNAEIALRKLGSPSLEEALSFLVLLAAQQPERYTRAARRWLCRFVEERQPVLAEVALAASALAELEHGHRGAGRDVLRRLLA